MTAAIRRISILVLCIVLALGGLWVASNWQWVTDQITTRQYHPDAAVTAIIERTDLSDDGRYMLYTGQPEIIGNQRFNALCATDDRAGEGSFNVLGCYSDDHIYVYKVSDPTLDGIMDVTTIHEMLHAAWQRLSDDEKTRITPLLEKAAKSKADDPEFEARMADYAASEPGNRANELHSIIGTEFADLSPALTAYYARYFVDRSKVVALYDKYETVFTTLQQRSDQLSSTLDALNTTINAETTSYQTDLDQLNNDIDAFNRRVDSGYYQSQDAYDRDRSAISARSDALTVRYDQLQADITNYNAMRDELIALNGQSDALNQSIDSQLAPPAPQPVG